LAFAGECGQLDERFALWALYKDHCVAPWAGDMIVIRGLVNGAMQSSQRKSDLTREGSSHLSSQKMLNSAST
jgi:hypothetical protein